MGRPSLSIGIAVNDIDCRDRNSTGPRGLTRSDATRPKRSAFDSGARGLIPRLSRGPCGEMLFGEIPFDRSQPENTRPRGPRVGSDVKAFCVTNTTRSAREIAFSCTLDKVSRASELATAGGSEAESRRVVSASERARRLRKQFRILNPRNLIFTNALIDLLRADCKRRH
jgi:hypothetical protein